ncbi:hypothetical protein [Planomicrobium sp. MB-3u-38]|nr:hypothetical protein [Planomicrobium sp. MB-3u-38]
MVISGNSAIFGCSVPFMLRYSTHLLSGEDGVFSMGVFYLKG